MAQDYRQGYGGRSDHGREGGRDHGRRGRFFDFGRDRDRDREREQGDRYQTGSDRDRYRTGGERRYQSDWGEGSSERGYSGDRSYSAGGYPEEFGYRRESGRGREGRENLGGRESQYGRGGQFSGEQYRGDYQSARMQRWRDRGEEDEGGERHAASLSLPHVKVPREPLSRGSNRRRRVPRRS